MRSGMKRLPPRPLSPNETGGKNLFDLEDDDAPPLELDLDRAPRRTGHSYIRATTSAPPPFEATSEDATEAWTDSQMWLTSTLLALEIELGNIPHHAAAAGPSTEWVRSLVTSFALVKDALFDLLAEALAAAPLTEAGSPLVHEVRGVYAWCAAILEPCSALVEELKLLQPDWVRFTTAIATRRSFLRRRAMNAVLRFVIARVEPGALADGVQRRVERVYFEALWIERQLEDTFGATSSSRPSPP
jgi:hypothetical protein